MMGTCGLRRPSSGLMARLNVPVGGRVKKLRAVEDPQPPSLGRKRARSEGPFGHREKISPTGALAAPFAIMDVSVLY
jgi:hypothetical protein